MKERPIIFSAPMVRAILEGRKTQTRRIVKHSPHDVVTFIGKDNLPTGEYGLVYNDMRVISKHVLCPYGVPGDRLWVRETWMFADPDGEDALPEDVYGPRAPFTGCQGSRQIYWRAIYRATNPDRHPKYGKAIWSPSIHMPRWASRIFLKIADIRIERLQDISIEDAISEGINCPVELDEPCKKCGACEGDDWDSPIRFQCNPRSAFAELWNSINGKHPGCAWDDNPYIWVVEFQRV